MKQVLEFIEKQVKTYNDWVGYGLLITHPKDDIVRIEMFSGVGEGCMVGKVEIKKYELLNFLEQIKEQKNGNSPRF